MYFTYLEILFAWYTKLRFHFKLAYSKKKLMMDVFVLTINKVACEKML